MGGDRSIYNSHYACLHQNRAQALCVDHPSLKPDSHIKNKLKLSEASRERRSKQTENNIFQLITSFRRLLVVALRTDFHLRALASSRLCDWGRHLDGRCAEAVVVAEEQHTLALALGTLTRFNPLAHTSALPHGLQEASRAVFGVRAVVLAHDGYDSLRSLVGIVERNRGNVVVEDVSLDDAVEKSATNEAKFTIDGGSSSASVSPGIGVVVRQRGIGVLQEGDGDEPVVDPEVRKNIPDQQVGEAVILTNPGQSPKSNGNANVAEDDEVLVFPLVQRAGRIEVVDTTEHAVFLTLALPLCLAFVEVVASDIAKQVHRPASKLLCNHVDERSNGRFLGQLMELVRQLANASSINLPRLGNENHITLHVAGGLVVLAVRDLPGEIRNKQS